jgi:ureidoglycolate dehydrogenase (NAD+)
MDLASELATKRVLPEDLADYCVEAMLRTGLSREDADTTATVLVTTDTWGTHTHGTKQLRLLLKNFREGRLDATATPETASEGPSWAIVDGHYAMPMVTSCRAMELAVEKAQQTGTAYVGAIHSSHFGAAGYYAVMAAEHDMIGLSMCNVDPGVTIPGARGSVLGTNPISYAAPAGEERPIFLDIATSAVAASKVYAAAALGREIPAGWLVDGDGVPTTDPSGYPLRGALLPMAGHKGYGLALLVEILSAGLTGAGMRDEVKSWVLEPSEPANQGHAFIAINVSQIMPIQEFKHRMDRLIREIKASPKARGSERIYLPGEMEWERRDEALDKGMFLPEDVVASLLGLAEDLDLDIGGLFG